MAVDLGSSEISHALMSRRVRKCYVRSSRIKKNFSWGVHLGAFEPGQIAPELRLRAVNYSVV